MSEHLPTETIVAVDHEGKPVYALPKETVVVQRLVPSVPELFSGLREAHQNAKRHYAIALERIAALERENAELRELCRIASGPLAELNKIRLQSEPLQGRDEVAWLIEQSFNSKAHWWYGSDFTDDAAQAVRFARKQDADQVILERGMVDAVASEHMWCQFETESVQTTKECIYCGKKYLSDYACGLHEEICNPKNTKEGWVESKSLAGISFPTMMPSETNKLPTPDEGNGETVGRAIAETTRNASNT